MTLPDDTQIEYWSLQQAQAAISCAERSTHVVLTQSYYSQSHTRLRLDTVTGDFVAELVHDPYGGSMRQGLEVLFRGKRGAVRQWLENFLPLHINLKPYGWLLIRSYRSHDGSFAVEKIEELPGLPMDRPGWAPQFEWEG